MATMPERRVVDNHRFYIESVMDDGGFSDKEVVVPKSKGEKQSKIQQQIDREIQHWQLPLEIKKWGYFVKRGM